MAEPMKLMYNETFLNSFGDKVHSVYPHFNTERFVKETMDETWEELELKGRIRKITLMLGRHLPAAFDEALEVLYAIDESCVGFPYLFFPDFVEVFGTAEEHWSLAMEALERFTPKSSAEFAVRPFLLRNPERMMRQMLEWSQYPNEHVRRLASEGCRPRLPWGQSLPMFKRDPSPILPVLEQLKADPSLYVRKSVANNLNDIAKDHPDLVLDIAKRWKGNHPHTDWIVRHGCRGLIRQGGSKVLALFGYSSTSEDTPLVTSAAISINNHEVNIGEDCEIRFELTVREGDPVRLRMEYGVDFIKANGRASRKLFLLTDKTVPGGSNLSGSRRHSWADLTTRRHYPGEHCITLLVNGVEAARTLLMVNAPSSENQPLP